MNSNPEDRFTDHGDGTVTDLSTGLMWQLADDGVCRTYRASADYCKTLDLAGHGDWRLPTAAELATVLPEWAGVFDDLKHDQPYWSSTVVQNPVSTGDDATQRAVTVVFAHGETNQYWPTYEYYVRAVRDTRGPPMGDRLRRDVYAVLDDIVRNGDPVLYNWHHALGRAADHAETQNHYAQWVKDRKYPEALMLLLMMGVGIFGLLSLTAIGAVVALLRAERGLASFVSLLIAGALGWGTFALGRRG